MANIINNKKLMTICLIVLFVSSSFVFTWVGVWHSRNKHRFRGEIVISADVDFKRKFNLPGLGTKNDPYRIEFLQINTTKDFAIKISHTTSYFMIRNCTLRAKNSGISIFDIGFGTALICNNTLNGIYGIQATESPGITIENNLCKYGYYGIYISNSLNSKIMNNQCINSTYGIEFRGNYSNSIIKNNFLKGNEEFGLHFHYWDWYSYVTYHHNYNVTISNNTCIASKVGLNINAYLELPTIEKPTYIIDSNNCSFNEYSGIGIRGYYLEVKNNFCGFNNVGIGAGSFHNSTVFANHLQNNTSFGIDLAHSSGSMIHHNNFFDNNPDGPILLNAQAFDDSTVNSYFGQNLWYNIAVNEGNFWSDLAWIPGITYDISGSNNTDLFPLQNSTV